MDGMTPEQIHQAYLEAERLRAEPAFANAMITIRKQALEKLATIEATSTDEIRDAQATVRAIDNLATQIGNAVLRWKSLPPEQRAKVTG